MLVEVSVPGAGVTWAAGVVAVATFILAVGAVGTAIGVMWQLRLNQEQHRLSFRPIVDVLRVVKDTNAGTVIAHLANIGPGPAADIDLFLWLLAPGEVKGDLDLDQPHRTSRERQGIAAQMVKDEGYVVRIEGDVEGADRVAIRVSYRDIFGAEWVVPGEGQARVMPL